MFTEDVRYALRMLRKSPLFAGAAIFSMALAIGANTAVFSLVNAVLVRQLPFKDPQRLLWIWSTRTDRDKANFCLPDLIDFLEQNRTMDQMAAFVGWGANRTGDGPAERLAGVRVSANVFEMLGARPALGRLLVADDDHPSRARVVVLSHGLWVRRFGGDPGVIERTLVLNGEPYRVVGVPRPDFIFPGAEAELATALVPGADPSRTRRDTHYLRVFGRMKPGVTVAQVAADMAAITARLRDLYPITNAKNTPPRVLLLGDEIVGGYKSALWILLGAVGLVLLIACSNLANLLLTKAAARRREVAVRFAMGAKRFRIVRQLLTESLVLAVLGGVLGLAMAAGGIRFLGLLSPADLPRAGDVQIDGRVLLFTLGVTLLAGVAFGLAPALQASRVNFNEDLKESGRGSTGARGTRARQALVLAEVALCFVLVSSAGLLVRSFDRLQAVDPGFSMPGLVTMRLSPPGALNIFSKRVLDKIRDTPGVSDAAMATLLPLSGGNARSDFFIAGQQPASKSDYPAAQVRWVSPAYFRTLGIPIRRGREFEDLDNPLRQPVAVIDETLAARFLKDADAVGSHLVLDMGDGLARDMRIVGVAGGVKHFSLDENFLMTIYMPIDQLPPGQTNSLQLAVRAHGDPMRVAEEIRARLAKIAADTPASPPRKLEEYWAGAIAARKFNRTLLAFFAIAALLLAASGLYALISYSMAQRTREIGIRVALGAGRDRVIGLVVGEGMRTVFAGAVVGLLGSFAAGRWLEGLLYGVPPNDLPTLAITSILLLGAGALAALVPAWRATRIDPILALRAE